MLFPHTQNIDYSQILYIPQQSLSSNSFPPPFLFSLYQQVWWEQRNSNMQKQKFANMEN